jgi:hypothetical protein
MEKKKKAKAKEYKAVKSKKVKGGYGSVYKMTNSNIIIGPDNKEYLHWVNIPANTLVLLTARGHKNIICEIVDSTSKWDGYGIYGMLYQLRDFQGNIHYFTSYDFRVLVIMKDAFGSTSNERYHLGIIAGLYNNINMNSLQHSNILHVITLDDNDNINSEIKNRFYNSTDEKDDNYLNYISSNDIHTRPTDQHKDDLKIYLSIFFNRVMKHISKDSLLSLYTINDRRDGWILSNVQNKQDIDNKITSSQSQPNFGSAPPPFGTGFGSGFGAERGSTPPPFGPGKESTPPPFGPGKGKGKDSTPPPFGSGFGSFDSASGQSPSPPPQNKPNDNIDAANAIIKHFFNNAKDLIENELTISEITNIDEYTKKQIMDIKKRIEYDPDKFKRGFKKALLSLHPDKKDKQTDLFNEILRKNRNIKKNVFDESTSIVFKLLNAINQNANSGGSNIPLYKRVYKKEILGKNRVIYKVRGSNKEYVKSKGVYISVIEYKKSINKKS